MPQRECSLVKQHNSDLYASKKKKRKNGFGEKKKGTDLNVNCKVIARPPSYFNALTYSNKDQKRWLCCCLTTSREREKAEKQCE